MANVLHRTWANQLSKRFVPFFLGTAALAAVASPARADVCFPTPMALPGLSGVPLWQGAGVLRTELNEPRWAAAPLTSFDNDPTGSAGLYRIISDQAYSELSVSFQAPTDLGSPSNADTVYFGFSTDGPGGNLAKGVVIQVNGAGGTDPSAATVIEQQTYSAAAVPKWTAVLGAPGWLKAAAVWRNNVAGDAAWGINFKVELSAAGLSAASAFKILLAMRKQDEANVGQSVNLSTPDPGTDALLAGTLFIADPTQWTTATAITSGCTGGITLGSAQIGTATMVLGSPAPSEIDTANGAVNHFFATPTVPGSIPLFSGLFQAKFHLANWSSASAPNAPWTPVPNGTVVLNGVAPATSDGSIEFDCPANTATTTCGIPTPSVSHQAMYVELMAAPGQTVPFTTAAAYRDVDFTLPVGSAGAGGAAGPGGAGGAAGPGGAPSGGNGNGGAADAGGGNVSGGSSNVSGAPSNSVAGASAGMSAHASEAGDAATDSAGSPGTAGAAAGPTDSGKGNSCGCRIVGRRSSACADLFALLVVAVSLRRRRRARHAS